MLLSSLIVFLTALSVAGAATFQLILDDPDPTACETPTTTSVVPTTTSVIKTPSLPPLVPTSAPTTPGSPKCSSCPDLDTNLCPPSGTLGIRYGRCYTMTDLGGRQFTRPSSLQGNPIYYYIGGNAVHRNIPFRVCANTTNCDLSQGDYVPEAGKWYLQDQAGSNDKPTAEFVGVKGSSWWLARTDSATNQTPFIASFTAKLKCLFGKCALCVRLASNTPSSPPGQIGILPWVGTGTEALLGEAFLLVSNNNSCLSIIFQETTCVAGL